MLEPSEVNVITKTTHENTSHTRKTVLFTYTTKLSQFDMYDLSPVIWTFIWNTNHTNVGYYVMEHNIHLFKPKNGLILNLRHIVFNVTILKILLFLHQLQVTTCTQLMPCRTK